MKVYIIYDKKNQPFVRGVFTSLKKAIKEQKELEESNRNVNDIFKIGWNRFTIKEVEINKIYYY